jgi:prevent-host-death family protein
MAKAPAKHPSAAADPRTHSVTSTEAQNSLGELLGRVTRGERVFITRYGRRDAVLLSAESYAELVGSEDVDLTELEEAFEARMERMRSVEQASAVDRLFTMTGADLGAAAVGSDPDDHAGG